MWPINFSLILALIISFSSSVKSNLTVKTEYGFVIGYPQTYQGRTFHAFKGIPFATPPIGNLRFKAPVPPKYWFIRATLLDAPFCPQILFNLPVGSEDCLYLNIYVPNVNNSKKPLPVMLRIHGGGFLIGTAASFIFGPEYFMRKDVILVTISYRLGVFGFLSTLDHNAPGNYGMKDQVLAMEFVKRNIKYFGGDENRITIFGESAGSASVDLHLVSPLSRDLFTAAICQSGVALNPWVYPTNELHLNTTLRLAITAGCGKYIGNNEKLINCLRLIDTYTLLQKFVKVQPLDGALGIPAYPIVVENKTSFNPKPFLEKYPNEYIKAGEFKKCPLIYGTDQDEGLLISSSIIDDANARNKLNSNFEETMYSILYLLDNPKKHSIMGNVSEFYLHNKSYVVINGTDSNIKGFTNLLTDRLFAFGICQNAVEKYKRGGSDIWIYNFAYRGNTTSPNGVGHANELTYFFPTPITPKLYGKDWEMMDDFITMWTNFAIFRNPDINNTFHWSKIHIPSPGDPACASLNFINITGSYTSQINFNMNTGFRSERLKFWTQQEIKENNYF